MKYVAVPEDDILKLEQARIKLIKMLESTELLNMVVFTEVTEPMWKLTHKKYKQIKG